MDVDFVRMVPRFLSGQRTGLAMCRAIEVCMKAMCDAAEDGIRLIQDIDSMPEWRLDELASEWNCLYDYDADIDRKRYWLKNARALARIYGTPQAIYEFLEGAFSNVEVEEWPEYGAEPFHFRVTVSDTAYDAHKIAWAQTVIERVKNVRSVLDAVTVETSSTLPLTGDTDVFSVVETRASETEWSNNN